MRCVIFDLGGVTIEWSNQTTYTYIEEKYSIPADDFKREAEKDMPLVQRGELSEEQWMTDIFHRFGVEGLPEVWWTTFEAARFNEEVLSIIQKLRRNDYHIAALSNLEPSRATWLRKHGIEEQFDQVVFSCEVGMRKPDLKPGGAADTAVYSLSLRRIGIDARDCAFVDDNVNCVEAAKMVGIKGVQFKNVRQLVNDLVGLGFKVD